MWRRKKQPSQLGAAAALRERVRASGLGCKRVPSAVATVDRGARGRSHAEAAGRRRTWRGRDARRRSGPGEDGAAAPPRRGVSRHEGHRTTPTRPPRALFPLLGHFSFTSPCRNSANGAEHSRSSTDGRGHTAAAGSYPRPPIRKPVRPETHGRGPARPAGGPCPPASCAARPETRGPGPAPSPLLHDWPGCASSSPAPPGSQGPR
jgi:hypothetical protein